MTAIWIAAGLVLVAAPDQPREIPNPLIDFAAFSAQVDAAGEHRRDHRVTEAEFIRMAADPATVILDARSPEKYAALHVRGAVNLDFTEFTAETLAALIPDKSTRILIYCNNNFLNEPYAFATKAPAASLNLHTYTALLSYGYTNVYELGPLIDIRNTRIAFEGTR